MVVYLAGGMSSFNDWRDPIKKELGEDIEFLDPRNSGSSDEAKYSAYDLECVRRCDVVLAYMSSANPSGVGMSLEMGYAYALHKYIIFVDSTDIMRRRYFGMNRYVANVVHKNMEAAIVHLRGLLLRLDEV